MGARAAASTMHLRTSLPQWVCRLVGQNPSREQCLQ